MIKFDDTGILTGYIKQKLHSFPLPTVDVLSKTELRETLVPDTIYIRDGQFQKYLGDNQWQAVPEVLYDDLTTGDKNTLNPRLVYREGAAKHLFTKTLEIRNNRYDSYTHYYLGEYLRFLRDYNQLDLMSLYNCFGNERVGNLHIPDRSSDWGHWRSSIVFDSTDPSYTIYAIPVRFHRTYTIALDSPLGVEIACGFYDRSLNVERSQPLLEASYKKYPQTFFHQPFLYSVSHTSQATEEQKNQGTLKLFLKVPANAKSSIVVLEGDYLSYNDSVLGNETPTKEDDTSLAQFLVRKQNHVVYNYEGGKFDQFQPISSLQLLRINSGVSYPFADRLVEYLTEQAITPLDTVERNIRRVQEMLLLRGSLWSDTEGNRQHPSRKIDASNTGKDFKGYSEINHPVVGINQINIEGQWEDKYRVALYDLAVQEGLLDVYNDFLGYVDKDVENELLAKYGYAKQGELQSVRVETLDTILEEGD